MSFGQPNAFVPPQNGPTGGGGTTGAGGVGISAGTQLATSGTVVLSNSNGFSFGMSNSSIVTASFDGIRRISGGTTNASGSGVSWANSNGLSWGINGQTVTGSFDGVRQISAGTTNAGGSGLSFVDGSGVSWGINGQTITASVAAAAADITYNELQPCTGYVWTVGQQGQSFLYLSPLSVPNVAFSRAGVGLFFSNATNSTGTVTASFAMGMYTRNAGSISLLHSTSFSGVISFSGTSLTSLNIGLRFLTTGWTSTITKGDYWVGILSATATAGTNATLSQILMTQIASAWSGDMNVATNATAQAAIGMGLYSVATAALPAGIAFTEIRGTGALALRPPAFRLDGTAP